MIVKFDDTNRDAILARLCVRAYALGWRPDSLNSTVLPITNVKEAMNAIRLHGRNYVEVSLGLKNIDPKSLYYDTEDYDRQYGKAEDAIHPPRLLSKFS